MIKNILIQKFKAQIPGEFEAFRSGKIIMNYRDQKVYGLAEVIAGGKPKTHNTTLEMDETTKTYLEALAGKTDEFSDVELIEFRIMPDVLQVWVYGIYDGKKLGKKMMEI
jgi:hypothetical protein